MLVRFSLLLVVTVVCLGCSGKVYTIAPVKGTLKIDEKPAGNIKLQFMPDASKGAQGPSSEGVTNENGQFELTTLENVPGAVIGDHVVLLVDLEQDRPAQGEESEHPSRIASSYMTERGGLRVTVQAGSDVELNVISGESPSGQDAEENSPPSDSTNSEDRSGAP